MNYNRCFQGVAGLSSMQRCVSFISFIQLFDVKDFSCKACSYSLRQKRCFYNARKFIIVFKVSDLDQMDLADLRSPVQALNLFFVRSVLILVVSFHQHQSLGPNLKYSGS
jgi:hypothetical protein